MPSPSDDHNDGKRPSLGSVLEYTWQRSRGSISLMLVGICTAIFLGVGLTSRCNIVSHEELVGFLGFCYLREYGGYLREVDTRFPRIPRPDAQT